MPEQKKKMTFRQMPMTIGDLIEAKISPKKFIGKISMDDTEFEMNLSWENIITLCNMRIIEKDFHLSRDSKILDVIKTYGEVMKDGGVF